ncbi:sulfatase [Acidobacteriota bacterium]
MSINRREFLKYTAAGLSGLSVPLSFSCKKTKSPPNILLICVDDLRPELGCYGKDYIKTPHLDTLAGEGIVFSRHFIQAPTCGPSRYSLLTGLRPKNTAELNNAFMENNFFKRTETETPETFVHHFRRNGYYTVGIGKISHTPDGRIRKDNLTQELPYSWDEMLCEEGTWGGGFDTFFAYANGESRASLDFQVPPLECADVPDEGYPDGLNANLTVRKLKELSGKKNPFLLSVGFYKPHLPFNSPKKYWDLYDRESISLSPNPEVPERTSLNLLHDSREFFGNYQRGKEYGSRGKKVSEEYAREIRHAYFAAVSYVDAQIGKVLNSLKDLGLDDNTIVVVWGDHGWHLGDHTIWGKHSPFERSTHSPLLIKFPGNQQPGSHTKALIETIDIYPTLCKLTGISAPKGLEGQSLVKVLNEPRKNGKQAVYSYQNNRISMRTDRYRLIAQYEKDSTWTFVLFDHKTDPYETINIAENRKDIVEQLLPLLNEGNTGIIPKINLMEENLANKR